ncbi:MAG: NAD-dependent protein deacylase [Rhodospirillaceae bacterium]|nr:NAD-dependent protein deacylase [Rhodospirillaceae bacterium]
MQIKPGDRIVILTGAGISKESGLDTFRDPDGIWARHSLEEVATPAGFARNPELVHAFYNARRRALADPDIQPNTAHLALAELEDKWPGEVLVVTQNIDDLHERAGSRNLIHMHGELLKVRSLHTHRVLEWREDLTVETPCPDTGQPGGLRPHVVWFGEIPLEMERIGEALERCALFVSIGTSGHVYPAAGFVREARLFGAQSVELNLEPSEGSDLFERHQHGPATEIVPAFVGELLAQVSS